MNYKKMISEKLSKSIQVANLISILLVASIHYSSKDYASVYSYNYMFQELLVNGIARIAVPFFALSSGVFLYLSYKKQPSFGKLIVRRIKSLGIPYIIASTTIAFAVYLNTINNGNELTINIGSAITNILLHPVAGHLWFIRDLMVLVLISPVLIRILEYKYSNSIIIILLILWSLELQITPIISGWYILNVETLFYFALGIKIAKSISYFEEKIEYLEKYLMHLCILWFVLICSRMYLEPNINIWYSHSYTLSSLLVYKLSILNGLLVLIAICKVKLSNNKVLLYLANFSFFIYLYHAKPLRMFLDWIAQRLISEQYTFYIEYPFAILLVILSAIVCEKHLPTIYKIITGNRGPKRKRSLIKNANES